LGERVDAACDWYAVGVLLYGCLTGRRPFHGSMDEVIRRKLKEEPPPPSTIVDGVPDDLEALCVDLLRRDPAARPTGGEVLARLRRKTSSLRPPPRGVGVAPSRFVGREAELAALVEAYRSRGETGTTTVVVRGESGVGKSALVG